MELTEYQNRMLAEYRRAADAEYKKVFENKPNPIADFVASPKPLTVGYVLRQISAGLSMHNLMKDRAAPPYLFNCVAISLMQDVDAIQEQLPKFGKDERLQKNLAAMLANLRGRLMNIAQGDSARLLRQLRPNDGAAEAEAMDRKAFKDAHLACKDTIESLANDVDGYELINGSINGVAKKEKIAGRRELSEADWKKRWSFYDAWEQSNDSFEVFVSHYRHEDDSKIALTTAKTWRDTCRRKRLSNQNN